MREEEREEKRREESWERWPGPQRKNKRQMEGSQWEDREKGVESRGDVEGNATAVRKHAAGSNELRTSLKKEKRDS